jgi:hypothetical protein
VVEVTGRGWRVRSVQTIDRRASERVADRRVRSLAGPARPVTHPGVSYGGQMRSDAMARPVTFDRTRPVMSGPLLDSDRKRLARPVACDRTRPVSTGAYWNATRRWHCRVQSNV